MALTLSEAWRQRTEAISWSSLIQAVPICQVSPSRLMKGDARNDPQNNPTVRVYQHLEDALMKAGAGNEGILALTTTREGPKTCATTLTLLARSQCGNGSQSSRGHSQALHGHSRTLYLSEWQGRILTSTRNVSPVQMLHIAVLPTSPLLPAP